MKIDWTHEAIEAAHLAMFQEPYDGKTAPMIGAGLDAAAAAQGIKDEEVTRLREENARLREAVKNAYYEGWQDSASQDYSRQKIHKDWETSEACAAIREGGK
jgi:hypothetical protein